MKKIKICFVLFSLVSSLNMAMATKNNPQTLNSANKIQNSEETINNKEKNLITKKQKNKLEFYLGDLIKSCYDSINKSLLNKEQLNFGFKNNKNEKYIISFKPILEDEKKNDSEEFYLILKEKSKDHKNEPKIIYDEETDYENDDEYDEGDTKEATIIDDLNQNETSKMLHLELSDENKKTIKNFIDEDEVKNIQNYNTYDKLLKNIEKELIEKKKDSVEYESQNAKYLIHFANKSEYTIKQPSIIIEKTNKKSPLSNKQKTKIEKLVKTYKIKDFDIEEIEDLVEDLEKDDTRKNQVMDYYDENEKNEYEFKVIRNEENSEKKFRIEVKNLTKNSFIYLEKLEISKKDKDFIKNLNLKNLNFEEIEKKLEDKDLNKNSDATNEEVEYKENNNLVLVFKKNLNMPNGIETIYKFHDNTLNKKEVLNLEEAQQYLEFKKNKNKNDYKFKFKQIKIFNEFLDFNNHKKLNKKYKLTKKQKRAIERKSCLKNLPKKAYKEIEDFIEKLNKTEKENLEKEIKFEEGKKIIIKAKKHKEDNDKFVLDFYFSEKNKEQRDIFQFNLIPETNNQEKNLKDIIEEDIYNIETNFPCEFGSLKQIEDGKCKELIYSIDVVLKEEKFNDSMLNKKYKENIKNVIQKNLKLKINLNEKYEIQNIKLIIPTSYDEKYNYIPKKSSIDLVKNNFNENYLSNILKNFEYSKKN